MEPVELLNRLGQSLDQIGVPYLVTGSTASIVYGEPRFTNDIDVVVQLTVAEIPAFCAAFPSPEFYCPSEAVARAVRSRFQFNVLHPESGLKIDVIIATDSDFDRSRFARRRRLPVGLDSEATFAAPEDVMLRKLEYFREGGSEKHLRDIVGMLKVQGQDIDQTYLTEWIARLGLTAEWALVEDRRKELRDGP